MLNDATIHATLRRHALLELLPEAAFKAVCAQAQIRHLSRQQVLFRQGEPANRFYVLIEGQVTLTRLLDEGQERLVEVIQPGNSFAEALLFSGVQQYPVTASTSRASTLVSLAGTHYRTLLQEHPGICLSLLASFSACLHQRLVEIDTLTRANAVPAFCVNSRRRTRARSNAGYPNGWWPRS
ncbi:Cyclic nucleotide-binding domain-containing protein [Pseudomonas lutea]|uniref:Cyclic nucleotide-binding domain-containing protein n=1 Tax=Pseudomonas lutea TaxID=243924 RepID=A0A9X8MDE8_9PSED|nr:Cyclic nucleotide-binding domain-containing protein [Pseudomonas lutea]